MLNFELKKLFKSRKILLIIIFAILVCLYSLLFLPNQNFNRLREESVEAWSSSAIVDYSYSDELNSIYDNATKVEDEIFSLELMLANKEEAGEDYIEDLPRYYQANLDGFNAKLNFVNENREAYPELVDSQDKLDRIKNIEWQVFKFDKILENKGMDYYTSINKFGDNALQQIFTASTHLFGLGPLILFIFLFSNFYSLERENETINLLKTQPKSRNDIILAKLAAIFLSSLIYVLAVLVFCLIIFIVKGVPLTGFNDIYRVFDFSNNLAYMTGLSLLIRMLLAFLLLINFWSILSMTLSIRYSSERTFAIVLSLFAILYILIATSPIFRTVYNPVFAMNILDLLLGRIELVTIDGITRDKIIEHTSPASFLLYLVLIIGLVLISFNLKEKRTRNNKLFKKDRIKKLFDFERIKLLESKIYVILVLGFIVFLISQYVYFHNLYSGLRDNFTNNSLMNKADQESIEYFEAELLKYSDEESILSQVFTNPEGKTIEDIPQEKLSVIEGQIAYLEDEIKFYKDSIESREQLTKAFEEEDSQTFYSMLGQRFENEWEIFSSLGTDLASGGLGQVSRDYNLEVFENAEQEGASPMPFIVPFISMEEDYLTNLGRQKDYSDNLLPITSAATLPYNLIKNSNLDILILILVGLAFFVGYTIDKNGKKHLEMVYTTPVSKVKYYFSKLNSQYVLGLILLLVLIGLMVVLGFISGGVKGWNFPIMVYGDEANTLIPLYSYLLRVFVAILFSLAFLLSLMTNLSQFIKTKNALFVYTIFIVVGMYLLSTYLPESIKIYSPFIYLRSGILADQSIRIFEGLANASYPLGLGVLFSWTIVNVLIGILIAKNKKA